MRGSRGLSLWACMEHSRISEFRFGSPSDSSCFGSALSTSKGRGRPKTLHFFTLGTRAWVSIVAESRSENGAAIFGISVLQCCRTYSSIGKIEPNQQPDVSMIEFLNRSSIIETSMIDFKSIIDLKMQWIEYRMYDPSN